MVPRVAGPVVVLRLAADGAVGAHLGRERVDAVVRGGVVLDVLADEVDALFAAVVVGEHDRPRHAAGEGECGRRPGSRRGGSGGGRAHAVAVVAAADAGGQVARRSRGPPATRAAEAGRRGRRARAGYVKKRARPRGR